MTTGGHLQPAPAAELALALLLAAARNVEAGDAAIARAGRFQDGVPPGLTLEGLTLGLVGLGRIGHLMARYGTALGMKVAAWSQNLTPEKAREAGAEYASKESACSPNPTRSAFTSFSDRARAA